MVLIGVVELSRVGIGVGVLSFALFGFLQEELWVSRRLLPSEMLHCLVLLLGLGS